MPEQLLMCQPGRSSFLMPTRSTTHSCHASYVTGMLWLPESPRWLLLSGAAPAEATDALRRAKGGAADEAVIEVGG